MVDGRFADLPAEEHLFALPKRGEVDEAPFQVFHLHTKRLEPADVLRDRRRSPLDLGVGGSQAGCVVPTPVTGHSLVRASLLLLGRQHGASVLDQPLGQGPDLCESFVGLVLREVPHRHETMIVAVVGAGQRVSEPPRAESSPKRLAAWSVLVVALITLAYVGRLTGGKPPKDVLYRYETAVLGAVSYGVILAAVIAICAGAATAHLLALRPPTSWKLAGGLAILILVAMIATAAVLERILHGGEEQGLAPTGWQPSRALAFALNAIVVAGVAPVVEELLFRGLGFTLLERFGSPVAIGAIGLTFGLSHGLVNALPVLVAFGIGLAYLRSRTRSVYPPIALHSAFNGISLLAAVAA